MIARQASIARQGSRPAWRVKQNAKVASLVACGVAAVFAAGGCERAPTFEALATVPTEREANRMVLELRTAGIEAARKVGTQAQRKSSWRVEVPPIHMTDALRVMEGADLPRADRAGTMLGSGQGGLIPSQRQERMQEVAAISADLERTLETIDGVVVARVHVSLPDADWLGDKVSEPRVGVFLKVRPGAGRQVSSSSSLTGDSAGPLETAVTNLVGQSIDGIKPTDIGVVVSEAQPVRVNVASPAPARLGTSTRDQVLIAGIAAIVLVGAGVAWKLKRSERKAPAPAMA